MADKKESKKKLTVKEITDQIYPLYTKGVQPERIVFTDDKPKFNDEAHRDVALVVYIRLMDNTVDVWMLRGKKWKKEIKNARPDRQSSLGHYDKLRWDCYQKDNTQKRKTLAEEVSKERLRQAVRYFYDLQKLRIQHGNRDSDQAEPAVLEADDKTFLGRQSLGLETLEKACLAEIDSMLIEFPIYTWLKAQPGCGPTMSGVLVAEIDIGGYRQIMLNGKLDDLHAELETKGIEKERLEEVKEEIEKIEERLKTLKPCDTPSALWSYAGLSVNTSNGRAVKREKGVKSNWNPFLKAKAVFVLGGNLLKASPKDKPPTKWRKFYDNYKHRKENQIVACCMLCEGKGGLKTVDNKQMPAELGPKGVKKCYNCGGKKHNVPWGRGDKHRHMAATRYMVKMFLLELWTTWRELEGLPVTEPYAQAKLGIKHGDHASVFQQPMTTERASVHQKTVGHERANTTSKTDTHKRAKPKKKTSTRKRASAVQHT